MDERRVLSRILTALLIGFIGVVGVLLVLSQGASAKPTLQEQAGLTVAKSDDPEPVIAGEALTYTLVIANSGPLTATGVAVTDTLPAGVTFQSATPSQGACGGTSTIVCALNSLVASDTAAVTIVVAVNPARRGTLTNTAEVSANEPDDTPSDNTDIEPTTVNAEADLAVTKADGPDPVIAGETLTYTLVITNDGPSNATGVTVNDPLPAGVTFVSATAGLGSYDSGTGVWTVGSLPDGASTTLTIVVAVNSSTTGGLLNAATISGNEPDPNAGNDTDTQSTDVDTAADLAVTKAGGPDPVIAGETLTYTLVITNDGPSNATGVTVSDPLPAGVTFVSATAGLGSYDSGTGVWTVGSLPDGASTTLTIVVAVNSSTTGWIFNSAVISGNEPDPDTDNNTGTQTTSVDTEADLAITKSAPLTVDAGEQLTYTLTFTNSGPSYATDVVVTDTLDSNVDYVSASPTPTGFTNGDPYWSFAPVAPGGSDQVALRVQVHSPLPNNTVLANTAWLDADQIAPLSATWDTTVHSSPVLTITKVDYPDPVYAGGTLGYTLVITNSGNENATSVTITEHYDPNVTFFSSSVDPDPGSENRVWTFPMVEVGDPESIGIVVEVASPLPVGTVLTNQVTLDSDQTTPITVTELTDVTSAYTLTISKVDVPDPVDAGGTLVYVITYQNSGTAPAEDVVITDTFDSRVTYSCANPGPPGGTDCIWYIGDVPVGEGGAIPVTVGVSTPLPNGTILINRVTIDSKYTSPKTFTETTHVSSAPNLAFTVADYPDPVEAGYPLTYTLRYTNTGNADATQVVVTATLDSRVSLDDATPSPDGGSDPVWYWDVGTIAGEGGYGEIVIRADVPFNLPDETRLDFVAQLGDAEGDFLEDTTYTMVTTPPDLTIEKLGQGHDPTLFSPGKLMTFILTYGNAGYGPADDVTIITVLPTGTTYVDTGYGWQSSDGVIYTSEVGDLPAGDTGRPIGFTVRHADTPEISAPEFDVPFTIAASGGIGEDANPGDNSTSVYIGVPDLAVADWTVEPEPDLLQPNEPVVFTVTLMNQGTGMAWNPKSCAGDPWDPLDPPWCGSWFLDFFTVPVLSYPYQRYGFVYTNVAAIYPGAVHTVVFTYDGFSEQELAAIHRFYVKVDNYGVDNYGIIIPYGLVPEFNEMNNLGEVIYPIYLPRIVRNWLP